MTIALSFLLLAAAFGSFLALGVAEGRSNGWKVPLVHGLIGTTGLLTLVLAARASAPPHAAVARGLAGFRPGAEVLLGLALLFGLRVFFVTRRGGRPSGLVVGTHALVAIGGIAMVLAIVSLG